MTDMMKKIFSVVLVVIFVVVVCTCVLIAGFISTISGGGEAQAACPVTTAAPAPSTTFTPAKFGKWNTAQMRNAAAIVAQGKEMGIPARGWVVALGTAMQESGLKNYANANVPSSMRDPRREAVGQDHDSVGLFQQRPNPPEGEGSWGTVAELMDPKTSAKKFYNALKKVSGWQGMSLTVAAQRVQKSAFPDEYAKWETDAEAIAAKLAGTADIALIGGGPPGEPCLEEEDGPHQFDGVSAGGWVRPVSAPVGSGFRTPERPDHFGVDLSAPRHAKIRSVTSGVVVEMVCNSSSGTCDRDGSPAVGGCGWYVDIQHAEGIQSRYCHMVSKPRVNKGDKVQAGQVIGFVGSSGNSSGPHLHFEIHRVAKGGYASNDNAVDPVGFMRSKGAPLEGHDA